MNANTTPVGRPVIAAVLGTIRGAGSLPRGSRAMSVKVSTGGGALGNEAPPNVSSHFNPTTDAVFFPPCEESGIMSILGTRVFLL